MDLHPYDTKHHDITCHDTQHVQGLGSREGPPRLFYGLSHDAMVWEYVLFNAHNYSLTPKFATSFCPCYFTTQKVSMALKVFATRKVIQIDGFAFGSSFITRAKRAPIIMP